MYITTLIIVFTLLSLASAVPKYLFRKLRGKVRVRSVTEFRKVDPFEDAREEKKSSVVRHEIGNSKIHHPQKKPRFFFFLSSVPLLESEDDIGGGIPGLVNTFLRPPLLGGCCCG